MWGKLFKIDRIFRPEELYITIYIKNTYWLTACWGEHYSKKKCYKPIIPSKHIKRASAVYRPAGNLTLFLLWSNHGLRTPREEIAFTARPNIQSQSQIFRYGQSIFCLPHWPHFSDIFYLCLNWVSVVRVLYHTSDSTQSFLMLDGVK